MASPTLAAQIQQVLALQPGAKWIQWEPVNRDNARAGARMAFGQYVEPVYDLTKADVILSLDADFLSSDGAHNLSYMRQFASRRRVEESADNLNRLYVVESDHTVTGGRADHRLALKSSQVEAFARAVAAGAGVSGRQRHGAGGIGRVRIGSREGSRGAQGPRGRDRRRCAAARGACARARDQRRDRRAGHVSADAGNRAVGTERRASPSSSSDINAGRVQMLVIVGESNPGVQRAGRLKFAEAMRKVSLVVHSGSVLRRDGDAEPLAHSRRALSRGLERRALHRRHRVDRAAADSAALRRQVGARSDRDAVGAAGAKRLRRRPGILAG